VIRVASPGRSVRIALLKDATGGDYQRRWRGRIRFFEGGTRSAALTLPAAPELRLSLTGPVRDSGSGVE